MEEAQLACNWKKNLLELNSQDDMKQGLYSTTTERNDKKQKVCF